MNKLMIGDEVVVRSGKSRGKVGEVLDINWKRSLVVVKNVNLVKKHKKVEQGSGQSGINEVEAPLKISKVGIRSPKTLKASRVGIKLNDAGKKVRYLKQCGTILEIKKIQKGA